jgi:hypothetical protein
MASVLELHHQRTKLLDTGQWLEKDCHQCH